jgi:hypothetical protein
MFRRWGPLLSRFRVPVGLLALALLVAAIGVANILLGDDDPATSQKGEGFRVGERLEPVDKTILGIRFAPTDKLVEDGVQRDVRESCPGGVENVPVDDLPDSEGFLPLPQYLPERATLSPPEYQYDPRDPNPLAVTCRDTGEVYRAGVSYTIPPSDEREPPAILLIIRDIDPHYSVPVAEDQISTVKVAARSAVLIDKSQPPQTGFPAWPVVTLVFPEDGGYLAVDSEGVPREEVFRVAESLFKEGAE